MSVYRSDLLDVGGFNTSITGWGGEDVDLYEKVIYLLYIQLRMSKCFDECVCNCDFHDVTTPKMLVKWCYIFIYYICMCIYIIIYYIQYVHGKVHKPTGIL